MTMVGRNGKRRIHIVAHELQALPRFSTACAESCSRRYVGGRNWTRRKVNCRPCLLALVEALTFSQFLEHIK